MSVQCFGGGQNSLSSLQSFFGGRPQKLDVQPSLPMANQIQKETPGKWKEPRGPSVNIIPERVMVSSVSFRVQNKKEVVASANCSSWIFSMDPVREKPRFPSVNENPERVRISSSQWSMGVAVVVVALFPAGVVAQPDGHGDDGDDGALTSFLVFLAFIGLQLLYGIFMMFLGAAMLRLWRSMMELPSPPSPPMMGDGPMMGGEAPLPEDEDEPMGEEDESMGGGAMRPTPSSRRGRSTTSSGSSSSTWMSPQDANDLRGVWAPWPPPDDESLDEMAAGNKGRPKGDGKGRLDPFNDLGIFRPGSGVSRRPPAPSSSTSEAEVQTMPQDDPMGLHAGEGQQDDDEGPPTTPGTEATEISGSTSDGGTFRLREPGQPALQPVQEDEPAVEDESNVVPPPVNQAMGSNMGPNNNRGPNYKAPPAVLGPPPPPTIFTTGTGTVYHLRRGCGKLKCARRVFEHGGCRECATSAFNGGRAVWILHGIYHVEIHGRLSRDGAAAWRPCAECGG